MIFLADGSDVLAFGLLLVVSISIPAIGLIVSLATMGRHGLNPWCSAATIVCFVSLLAESISWTLGYVQGLGADSVLQMTLGGAGGHAVSAAMAIFGIVQVRRRRRWTHGRRRALWIFGLNILLILGIGFWCYMHVNQSLYERLK